MNPNAKEFVPAHILRKRQESEQLNDLTSRLDDVKINSTNEGKVTSSSIDKSAKPVGHESLNSNAATKEGEPKQDELSSSSGSQEHKKPNSSDEATSTTNPNETSSSKQPHINGGDSLTCSNDQIPEDPSQFPDDYPDDLAYDDNYFLDEGEQVCEFNGEQFIIPGE